MGKPVLKKCIIVFCFFLLLSASLFAQTRPDALQAFRDGQFELSIQICRDEIAENPNNIESHVVIAWSLMALGRHEEALQYATAGRLLSRYDIRTIRNLGEINFFLGRNNDALLHFREFISLAPTGTRIEQIYYFMGETYIRMGRFRRADVALTTAVHRVPGNAVWWTRLGYARENAGDLMEAVVAYERALALNPQSGDARRGLDRVSQTLARS